MVEVAAASRRRTLLETQAITRLGEGLGATGELSQGAMTRTLTAVSEFCRTARTLGAGETLIVATSAVREAKNRDAFVDCVQRATGERVRVVPGDEEARLTLLGVLDGLPGLSGGFVVFDIGGGSSEFILARGRRLAAAVSLPLGVVRLAERYMSVGPVDWVRYAQMEREIRSTLRASLGDFAAGSPPDYLIGTAGTVTTLAALDLALRAYEPERVQGYVLARPRIEGLLKRLGQLSVAERALLPCLEPGRADLIIPGTAVCLAAMEHFGLSSVSVSHFGLREGILIEHLSPPPP